MDKKNIAQWLVNWFVKRTGQTGPEIEARITENYFETGLIDSFAFIELVADLEDAFAFEFDNEAFEDRSFASIQGLAKIVQDLLTDQ